jgi:hypothetical protein
MIEVEQLGSWSSTHKSFTEWLMKLSLELKLNESNLWRFFRSGKYYLELSNKLNLRGINSPPFSSLSHKVSPENLEILEKIERVVSESTFLELSNRVISCNITRNELREIWEAYRVVLSGLNARGMGVSKPRLDHGSSRQISLAKEAQVLTALISSNKEWIGCDNPFIFEVLKDIRIPTGEIKEFHVDAAVIFKGESNTPIKLIGIDIKSSNARNIRYESLQIQKPYFEYHWVAFHSFDEVIGIEKIPEYVGVIVLKGTHFRLIRKAIHVPEIGFKTSEMLKVILEKVLRK